MKRYYYELRRIFLILYAALFYPVFILLIRLRRKSDTDVASESDFRVLVIPHLTRIGDLVCATPVFRAIKEKYPDSHLAVLVAGRIAPLLKNNPRVDEVIIYRHFDLWGTINRIRNEHFDWSFSLSGTSMSSIIAFLGMIPNRAKITRRPRPISEFFTDCFSNFKLRYKHHTYILRHYLDLLSFIGIDNPIEKKEVFTTLEGDKKALPYKSYVGISIAAGNKIKEWGDLKFQELAKKIHEKYRVKIVFIGSKSDDARIEKILFPGASKATDFSLEELPSLIKNLKLFVGVDTGLIYIAHALGKPLIDIIGPVDPNEQPPRDEKSIQVLPPAYIKPSSFVMKKPGTPDEHKKATQSISVDDVMKAVEKLLN